MTMTIVITMCKLFFAMAVGFYLNKRDILNPEINKKLSSLIVDVTCPFLIISSASSVSSGDAKDVLLLLITGAAVYILLPFIAMLVVKILRVPKDSRGVYQCMVMFSNNSFMGYPVVEALFGGFAIFYTTIFHMGFNFLFFTYGTFIMAKDAGAVSKFNPKRLINTGVIASIIALIIYFAGIQVPEIILSPLSFVGNITTPLSMLVIGSNMASYKLSDVFKEKKIYAMVIVRLVILPLLAGFGMSLVTDNATLISIVVMTVGMPVGALVAMGSSAFEKQGKIASIGVVVTTLFSMVTIPLTAVLLNLIL